MIAGIALFAAAPAASAQAQAAAANPVVIELFVSQACGACYKATNVARRVADSADALLLTYAVDYWDYRGWKDTFARPEHKARQEAYRGNLENRRLYTPQAVVQGAYDVRGDSRDGLNLALDAAPLSRVRIISSEMVDGGVRVALAEANLSREVDIWIAPFMTGDVAVNVHAGENKGRSMQFRNVVRGMAYGGKWDGRGENRMIPVAVEDAANACAIIVQEANAGRILAVSVAAPSGQIAP